MAYSCRLQKPLPADQPVIEQSNDELAILLPFRGWGLALPPGFILIYQPIS